ncbi:MAG: DUF3047 domain-containing protein [Candidatus Rokubacteria bacterium]|nr:DUF3047 domain-containing protein [Candidatus Rokubacteria bacterium]
MRHAMRLLAALMLVVPGALAASPVVIADWADVPVGHRGIPPGWVKQTFGSPKYDFAIVEADGRKVLHMQSRGDDNSTITKEIRGRVNLKETPILEWSWKVVTLPAGADARKAATDDQAAQVYVIWERFPQVIRSQIIGYIWDTTASAGAVFKSQKTGTVTYVVVRSGSEGLGTWHTERRNVREDYMRIYGGDPPAPAALSVAINSQNTGTSAESFIGAIRFLPP